ncbi:hypothetical protein DID88_005429 [Monilinia fructigena]|uniref:Uncharacterized protein n=1 Tax=Monilinia fructigena TaxID=38457 RepID=A0A395J0Y5_9HELO|nr:hypothetical protein DID88_005429 [Monilinia fructigena]
MPPLRHSISQIFAPHPALALRNPRSHEQSIDTAPAVTTDNNEMVSSLQPKRPMVPIPSPTSTRPTNPPTDQASLPSSSPSIFTTPYPISIPPLTQIEALPPHITPTSYQSSPFAGLTHKNGTFILDSAIRHPVFFTDKLRKAPSGVMTYEYGNDVWRSGSPVARGYVYESGGVEEREAKL